MPLAPYAWQLNDYLSATLLNGEMFGLGFAPNGVGFHAAKPVYAAGMTSSFVLPITTSIWALTGKNNTAFALSSIIRADTGGYFGARMDPGQNGTVDLGSFTNGGGASGTPGGLGLMSAFVPMSSGTGVIQAGLGPWTNSTPASAGTCQQGHASAAIAPWALDIVDLNDPAGALAGWVNSSQTTPTQGGNQTDTSDRAIRTQAHWVSVYPGNGSQTGSTPAPRTTWSSGSPSITAALMNGATGIRQLMRQLNMPPLLRVTGATVVSVPTGFSAGTAVPLGSATYDTYGGWSNSTDTYTVPVSGLYLLAGFVPYNSIGSTSTRTGVLINGSSFWGPKVQSNTASLTAAGKVGIFDLTAGDTIQLVTEQNSGSTQNGSNGGSSLLVALFLGALGAPSPLPSPPDVTYSWQAGTPGSAMPALMTSHTANDLNFLNQRPFLLSQQVTTASTYTAGVNFQVNMDNITGMMHGSAGDPYSGWDSTNKRYVAPCNGWYLAVQETFFALPNDTTGVAVAKFRTSQPGNAATDSYQANTMAPGANGGASALGYYYLRAGDWIAPWATQSAGTTGLSTSLSGSGSANSHFEVVWISE